MGDIGVPQRHIEFEPLPQTEPAREPAAPSVPDRESVPA